MIVLVYCLKKVSTWAKLWSPGRAMSWGAEAEAPEKLKGQGTKEWAAQIEDFGNLQSSPLESSADY